MDTRLGTRQSLPPMILPQHGLTRYLRVRLQVDDGVLVWERPRTVLGVVPLGVGRLEIPLASVRSLRLQRRTFRPVRLMVGLLLLATPLAFLTWWLAVPMMVMGAWVTLVSLGPRLEVRTRSDGRHRVPVCFEHQFDVDLFIEAVEDFMGPAGVHRHGPILEVGDRSEETM